uniref:Uncharacterized protein n=1 Tax=Schizaphis graminum TaxID=13262 RepID=A0A2S2PLG8_SCHGA
MEYTMDNIIINECEQNQDLSSDSDSILNCYMYGIISSDEEYHNAVDAHNEYCTVNEDKDKDVPRDIDIISCSEDDTDTNYDSDKDPEYVPVHLQNNNASVLSDNENVTLGEQACV